MANSTITHCETGATKELEIQLQIGRQTALVTEGGARLFHEVGEWNPNNVGGIEFDLQVGGILLKGCVITAMGAIATISFMERA